MKLGRRLVVALFVLFCSGGALSALLLEGMEALHALPSVLLSLLFLELLSLLLFLFLLDLVLLLRSVTRQLVCGVPRLLLLPVGTLLL